MAVALDIQHAMCIHRITLASASTPALPFFPSPHKQHIFWKTCIQHKMYVFVFSTTCLKNVSF